MKLREQPIADLLHAKTMIHLTIAPRQASYMVARKVILARIVLWQIYCTYEQQADTITFVLSAC